MMQVKTLVKCKLILNNILNDYTVPLTEVSERDEYCQAICFPLVSQTPAPLTPSNNTLHNDHPSSPPFARKDRSRAFWLQVHTISSSGAYSKKQYYGSGFFYHHAKVE
jgi:hypothetical protein